MAPHNARRLFAARFAGATQGMKAIETNKAVEMRFLTHPLKAVQIGFVLQLRSFPARFSSGWTPYQSLLPGSLPEPSLPRESRTVESRKGLL